MMEPHPVDIWKAAIYIIVDTFVWSQIHLATYLQNRWNVGTPVFHKVNRLPSPWTACSKCTQCLSILHHPRWIQRLDIGFKDQTLC